MTLLDRSKLWLGAMLLLGCTTKESKPGHSVVGVPSAESLEEEPSAEADADRQPGEAVLLGVIRSFGTHVCNGPDDASSTWKDEHVRAGLVRIEGRTEVVDALRGEPAILFGRVTSEGKPKLAPEEGNCMPIQRRSDQVPTPDGIVLEREPMAGIAAFRVRSAQRFDGLRAKAEGNELSIELHNPLNVSLLEATLVVHYEGCYGKPMTHEEKRELGTLARGGSGAAKVPLLYSERRAERDLTHRAHSIQVLGKADGVYFDLDVRLDLLGAQQSCPKR